MPFPLLIPAALGAGSFLGGLFGHKQSSTPITNQAYQPLEQMLLQHITSRLTQGLPAGYEAGGVNGINQTFGLAGQLQNNNLTARGLAGSPVAATVDQTRNLARTSAISQFQQSLPLLQQDRQSADLNQALALLRSGQGQTGSVGGGVGGGISGLAQMLGFLVGSGQLGQGGNPLAQFQTGNL